MNSYIKYQLICAMVKVVAFFWGWEKSHLLIGNPYNGHINPYYFFDDHPLLYGNDGSLDPGTFVFIDFEKTSTVPMILNL